ncbi:hypothetical protein HMPREF5505_0372 [Lactobacillus delbrueckii subsp. lactis DSM 20072]|nr:hypothetical protein HMPREF5505_0372 [Lactobacillus delbrueckii subsp. lactis DSM 20072]
MFILRLISNIHPYFIITRSKANSSNFIFWKILFKIIIEKGQTLW